MSKIVEDLYSGSAEIGKLQGTLALIAGIIIGICCSISASFIATSEENKTENKTESKTENTMSNTTVGFILSCAGVIVVSIVVLYYYALNKYKPLAALQGASTTVNLAKRIFD
jgi:uncharacterized BrkB/YihY/UPF0761 family membrane protein